MKTLLSLLLITGNLANVFAQGSIEFAATINGSNELSPNNSFVAGTGTFSLSGSNMDFTVSLQPLFAPISGGIYGPANASQTGSLIFDLGAFFGTAPYNGFPGSIDFFGNLSLNAQQISDLESGLWYVNILTPAYPAGEARGQIAPVPEPSARLLLSLGAAFFFWKARRQHHPMIKTFF